VSLGPLDGTVNPELMPCAFTSFNRRSWTEINIPAGLIRLA